MWPLTSDLSIKGAHWSFFFISDIYFFFKNFWGTFGPRCIKIHIAETFKECKALHTRCTPLIHFDSCYRKSCGKFDLKSPVYFWLPLKTRSSRCTFLRLWRYIWENSCGASELLSQVFYSLIRQKAFYHPGTGPCSYCLMCHLFFSSSQKHVFSAWNIKMLCVTDGSYRTCFKEHQHRLL